MGVFKDIELEWRGSKLTIPANRVMGAIALIEESITLKEIFEAGAKGKVKLSKISAAYGSVLRYAGAKVDDEEVYAGMFAGESSAAAASAAVTGLLSMMVPPGGMGVASGGKSKPAAVPSSKKPSKQRSAPGG